ncbi:putative glycerophosphodiester phosphodiesterase [Rosa chinensis]|uniref:Putative glycerophosphodiester phosphodiesterase n=1 Tax=Rosa chinensis TaxID=74649 RepID=A0A2P6RE74_ROSCH|nr:putative glycerophosphodiester phosphodiesterase [Rosa chinensis]
MSYKSDVYSFGTLLLEMVGGRENFKVTEDSTSEVYFPEWIYNFLEEGNDLRIHIEDGGDGKIARKLAIVGLWCIQWHPVDRPPMPPNPFASNSN